MPAEDPSALSADQIRKIARLARLALSAEQIEAARPQLAAVLTYVQRLQSLDLRGVEPLTHPGDLTTRPDADTPGPTLAPDDLKRLAPEMFESFIKVPKVLDEGSGA